MNARVVASRLRTSVLASALGGLVSCASDDGGIGIVTSTETASGRWSVTLPDGGAVPTGNIDLRLHVTAIEDATAPAIVSITLAASMPGMDMGADETPATCADSGAGDHDCPLTLTMTGLWDLAGTILTDDEATPESFALRVEAR